MAAGVIPAPGKHGPCKRCEHIDCRELRSMALALCHWCGQAIGYGHRYYRIDGQYVHARCEETAVEEHNQ